MAGMLTELTVAVSNNTHCVFLMQVYKAFYQSKLVAVKMFPLEARAKGEVSTTFCDVWLPGS